MEETKYIFIRISAGNIVKLFISDIVYIEVKSDYCFIHTKEDEYKFHSNLKKIYDKLPQDKFVKCHRNFLVNIENIQSIKGKISEGVSIQTCRMNIPVSDTCVKEVYNKINLIKPSHKLKD